MSVPKFFPRADGRYDAYMHGSRLLAVNVYQAAPAGQSVTPPSAKRGKVTGLSGQSRKNLRLKILEFLPRVMDHGGCFVSLTYGADAPSDEVFKKHRKAFFARLNRRHPDVSAIWVLEFQERGAHHVHFLADESLELDFVRKAWLGVTGSSGSAMSARWKYAADVRSITDGAEYLALYLSKELSKSSQKVKSGETKIGSYSGRWWGCHNLKPSSWKLKKPMPLVHASGALNAGLSAVLDSVGYLPPRAAATPQGLWVGKQADLLIDVAFGKIEPELESAHANVG